MTQFIDDDADYFAWIDANPTGFVVNCYRNPTPTYLFLHRSTCYHIQHWEGRTLTEGAYRKVCAPMVAELQGFAAGLGGTLTPCRSCQPVSGS
jgi:hypothetical protein